MSDETNVSLEFLQRKIAQLEAGKAPPLHSGGGGGTFDGMEARVKRLEDDSKEFRADLKAIRSDVGEIKGRLLGIDGKLSGMPTTWTILQINAALLALAFAIAVGTITALKAFAII